MNCDGSGPHVKLRANRGALCGKILLLTGQRLSEVAGMADAELQSHEWHLSAGRTKNKRAHMVPITGAVRDVLDTMERIDGPAGLYHHHHRQDAPEWL